MPMTFISMAGSYNCKEGSLGCFQTCELLKLQLTARQAQSIKPLTETKGGTNGNRFPFTGF
jgi:hypothetical protein